MLKKRVLLLPRRAKRFFQLAVDLVVVYLALSLSYVFSIGIEGFLKSFATGELVWIFIVTPIVSLPIFYSFGLYHAVIRHWGREAFHQVIKAALVASLVLMGIAYVWVGADSTQAIPRALLLYYGLLSILFIATIRVMVHFYLLGEWPQTRIYTPFLHKYDPYLKKVIIYGAGSSGQQLVSALRIDKKYLPVAFIDDDETIQGRTVSGILVYKPEVIERVATRTAAKDIFLAMPSASRTRRKEILQTLEKHNLAVRTIPGFVELAEGKVQVEDVREVDIADLLGREPVQAHRELFERCITGMSVMVTGAGGSIGSELCRQIVKSGAKRLILYEHSEFNLYAIDNELKRTIANQELDIELIPIVGSIRNPIRLSQVMSTWEIETVYHAAAYKHVPMVEANITEGVLNNVFGTLHTAQAAIKAGVQNFVLISTDKAVRPTNIMGATKRLAELVLQALSKEEQVTLYEDLWDDGHGNHNNQAGVEQERIKKAECQEELLTVPNRTRFTMVRFGNVLGSSGSVIPLFRRQIEAGGPVTVTDPQITRYFMTIPEATELVIQAGSMGQGGDVFVLDMGEPVRIYDLALKMIQLSGFAPKTQEQPEGDIEVKITGLRPGEKLYEELLIGDDVLKTEHPMIMRAEEVMIPWSQLIEHCYELRKHVIEENCAGIRTFLQDYVQGYTPSVGIVDFLYSKQVYSKQVYSKQENNKKKPK